MKPLCECYWMKGKCFCPAFGLEQKCLFASGRFSHMRPPFGDIGIQKPVGRRYCTRTGRLYRGILEAASGAKWLTPKIKSNSRCMLSFSLVVLEFNDAKSDIAGRTVRRVGTAGRNAVAVAIGLVAEERAAAQRAIGRLFIVPWVV